MNDLARIENVLIQGDISRLSPEERTKYYTKTCETLGLNPLTKPFDYITLNGKLTLYAKRDCTDQLRKLHNVSIVITSRTLNDDIYSVTAQASVGNRTDESIGAVYIGAAKGEAKANLLMKAETKAKRRVTLSICGLGLLDETEVESVHETQVKPRVQATPKTAPNEFVLPLERIEQVKQDTQRLIEEDALIKAVDDFAGVSKPTVMEATPVEHHPDDSAWYRKQREQNNKPTDKQIKMIGSLVRQLTWNNEVASDWLKKSFGVSTREELDKKQASAAIELLMAMRETGEPDYRSVETPDELRGNEADL